MLLFLSGEQDRRPCSVENRRYLLAGADDTREKPLPAARRERGPQTADSRNEACNLRAVGLETMCGIQDSLAVTTVTRSISYSMLFSLGSSASKRLLTETASVSELSSCGGATAGGGSSCPRCGCRQHRVLPVRAGRRGVARLRTATSGTSTAHPGCSGRTGASARRSASADAPSP